MPYKNPEQKRAYHREYMRRQRTAVNPELPPELNPIADAPQFTRRRQMNKLFDRNRPYTVESRYPWPAYLVQDGLWFDPETEKAVGVVR